MMQDDKRLNEVRILEEELNGVHDLEDGRKATITLVSHHDDADIGGQIGIGHDVTGGQALEVDDDGARG